MQLNSDLALCTYYLTIQHSTIQLYAFSEIEGSNMAPESTKPEPPAHKIVDAARGEDKPISAKRPDTPFALVLGSYPIALVVGLLAILLYFFLFR